MRIVIGRAKKKGSEDDDRQNCMIGSCSKDRDPKWLL
jgi:hypothetical protein